MLHENHNLYKKKRKSCLYINLASEFSEWDRIVKRWAAVHPVHGTGMAGLGTSNKMEHKGETEASVQWQFSQQ